MQIRIFITTLFFMLLASTSVAQVTFEAKVSKKKLGINERLRIDFEMDRDGDNFTPPNFSDFRVVGGPSQSMSNVWVNGKRTFSKTYTYFLQPRKQGKFTIKQAKIEVEGQVYKTLPVTVEVTAAVEKPKDGNNADYIASENLHLVAEVSNANPYINEPVTVIYKLYVKDLSVSNYREIEKPKYNNFWSQNIEVKRFRAEQGTYKGEAYSYVVVKKVVLYPQKFGKQKIEPLSVDLTVDVPTKRRDIFGGRMYKSVHKTISAGNRTITVKPLPEAGKPADFSGAVGSFDFNVTTSKTQLNASESLQAKVEVSGKGNLKLFELPELNLPSSLEVYDPEFKETVSTRLSGMQGKIVNNYTVIPQFKGKYPIPSISFTYFDPKEETYKTLNSDEIIIDVLEGPTNTTNTTSTNNTTTKTVVSTNGNQFRFISSNTALYPSITKDFFKSPLFYGLLTVPLLFIPVALIVRRKKKALANDVQGNKKRAANRLAKKYLSEAKKTLGQKESFYIALERALHNYLKAKINIETSEFSKEKIKNILSERNVQQDTIANFIALLESCEFARYTPASNVTMNKDYEKSVQTLSQIDKQIS